MARVFQAQCASSHSDCDGNVSQNARVLSGRAPGHQGSVLPGDVSKERPGHAGWFILQVHDGRTTPEPADDASGMRRCIADAPGALVAAVQTPASLDIAVPPRRTTAHFGERTEVEGCFAFALASRASALADDFGAASRRCI
ncbi:MAG: hypothetical protein U0325_28980 [Polyangiales bacterium]